MVKRTRFPLPDEDEPVVEPEEQRESYGRDWDGILIWCIFGPVALFFAVIAIRFLVEVIYIAVNTPLGGFIK